MHFAWLVISVLCFSLVKICPSKTLRRNQEKLKPDCPYPIINVNGTDMPIENVINEVKGSSEVKFNGLFGKMEKKRFCKLKCINGEWFGPLCLADGATGSTTSKNTKGDSGEGRFHPVFRSCTSQIFQTKFILSYKNKTITDIREFEHNEAVVVRCKVFGYYKLIGDAHLKCQNGEWKNRIPSCIRTSSLTNFTDESAPPTVLASVASGSFSIEPSGAIAVYPGSTVHLECMYLRSAGEPEWSWTSTYRNYATGWSIAPDERDKKFRLSIYYIKSQDTGIYTCSTPKGNTHSIVLNVIAVHCDTSKLISTDPNLLTHIQGSRLGHVTTFQCREGFKLNGTSNMTCQASGVWSDYSPRCIPIVCPDLQAEENGAKLLKQDVGYGGTAVFQCPYGHKLIGLPTLVCLNGGKWSGTVPTCKEIFCTPPLIPPNGKLEYGNESSTYPYRVGAVLTFSCKGSYQLIGEVSIVCQDSGFWSKPPPFCKPKCPHPGDPPNGQYLPAKENYDVGERISLTCTERYEPSAKSRPRCQKNGMWTETGLECKTRKTFRLVDTTTTTITTTSTSTPAITTTPSTTSPLPPTTATSATTTAAATTDLASLNVVYNMTDEQDNSTDIYYVIEEQPI